MQFYSLPKRKKKNKLCTENTVVVLRWMQIAYLHLLKSTQIIVSTQQLLAAVAATHSPTRLSYGISVNGQ